jgi:serine phosphatase RsbU (regulator of sigma subunit)
MEGNLSSGSGKISRVSPWRQFKVKNAFSTWYNPCQMVAQPPPPNPNPTSESNTEAALLSHELFLSAMVQEVSRVMLSAENLPRTLHTCLWGIAEIAGQRPMALFVVKEGTLSLETHFGEGLRKKLKDFKPPIPTGRVAECLRSTYHIWVERQEANDPFAPLCSGGYLLVPLVVGGSAPGAELSRRCVAILWLDAGESLPPLTGQGLSYSLSLAQLAALRIENFRMNQAYESANANLQKTNSKLGQANHRLHMAQKAIEEDLNRARTIQDSLLPNHLPRNHFRDIASRYIPAGKVGGDYWDCFELPNQKLGLVIADVSGHGISAALVMTMFKVLLKTFAASCDSPAQVLQRVNDTFLTEIESSRHFVTVFYGVYDLPSRRLTWTNAGHLSQIALLPLEGTGMATGIDKPDQVESWDLVKPLAEMSSVGLVLGMFSQTMITDRIIDLPQGSRIMLFTDGITEAHDPQGKMFTPARMNDIAMATRHLPAEELAAFIMQTWRDHLGPTVKGALPDETADDATLVILDL